MFLDSFDSFDYKNFNCNKVIREAVVFLLLTFSFLSLSTKLTIYVHLCAWLPKKTIYVHVYQKINLCTCLPNDQFMYMSTK